jgi:hypothetical protein
MIRREEAAAVPFVKEKAETGYGWILKIHTKNDATTDLRGIGLEK